MKSRKRAKQVVMVLKCSGCGKKREVKPGEIHKDDFPMCDECFMPMLPQKVRAA